MELVNRLEDKLLLAVPKKGRLAEKTLELLKGADIQFHRNNRLDIAFSTSLPVALVFLPAADIPRFVGEGRCSLGITGIDQVAESQVEVEDLLDLHFGSCELKVQVPQNEAVTDTQSLIGKTIVSSFQHLTREYFRKLEGKQPGEKLQTSIKYIGGSVEAAVALGVADAIVDLVESGETMRAAGLKPIHTVLKTSAHLIASKNPTHPDIAKIVTSRICGYVTAKKYVLCNYNTPRSALPAMLQITPGRRAATVSPLQDEEWVAVSSMVEAKQIAGVMDQLKDAGATDILVFNISNCRA